MLYYQERHKSRFEGGDHIKGSIITTVSLDLKTKSIANQMPNFSHFVRECLLRYHVNLETRDACANPYWANREDQENEGRFQGRCNPVHKDFMCYHCWPFGRPPKSELKKYLDHDEFEINDLDMATRQHNVHLFHMGGASIQEDTKTRSDPPLKASFVSKLLRKFK